MSEIAKHIVLNGYAKTAKRISALDEHKVIDLPDIAQHLGTIESVMTYYEREFEAYRPDKKGEATSHKTAYSIIKTIESLCLLYPNQEKVDTVFSCGGKLPRSIKFVNEILCWDMLMIIYENFIGQTHLECPAFCELHFEDVMYSFVTVLFRSRDRLSDISPSYVELLFNLLIQTHLNIAHNSTKKLFNRTGFLTYIRHLREEHGTLVLMNCDIDKFSQVNNDNNHKVGDEVLHEITDILAKVCDKHNGVPARVGGEEFWLAFHNTEVDASEIFSELQRALSGVRRPNANPALIAAGEYKEHMTMSVAGGVAPKSTGFTDEEIGCWFDLLDEEVFHIKNSGRDGYRLVPLPFIDASPVQKTPSYAVEVLDEN